MHAQEKKEMKVTLIQMNIVWETASKNRETAEQLMLSAEKSDLYVLPEMWNTGVTIEPEGVAENENGETLQWMQQMANKLDAAVAGSIAVKTPDGQYRNRLHFIMPQKSIVNSQSSNSKYYDKHHLFSYGGETLNYTPGNERVTVEWRGIRFRLSIWETGIS